MSLVEPIAEIEATLKHRASRRPRPASKTAEQNEKPEENVPAESEPDKIGTFDDLLALDPTKVVAIRVGDDPWVKVRPPSPSKNHNET